MWAYNSQQFDYGIVSDTVTLFFDHTSAINIFKNPIQHSCIKYIDIRHHFICELVEDQIVSLEYVPIKNKKADLVSKSHD